jgi:tRNA pseudouridine13 synthase
MEFYGSPSDGVPGRLKSDPEAFRVREISSFPRPDPEGAYTVLRVESRGWEQHELAEALGRKLGLPRRSIRWAGTKDRRAVAERLLSYRGAPPTGELTIPDARVLEAYRARDGLALGHHYGNAFEIRVDGIAAPAPEAIEEYRRIEQELRSAGGCPNFFGPQRFGEVRPVTHEVGRAIVRGRWDEAVDRYLTARVEGIPDSEGDAARASFASHRDPRRALAEFPPAYRFERSLLERLARGETPERAGKALPFELRRLFVHAYQAYLFNRYLSSRHAVDLSPTVPEVGDAIVRIGRDGTVRGQEAVEVGENAVECRDLVARGRALVAGPLVGYGTRPLGGRPGEILRPILEEEKIPARGFEVPATPELASEGAWRPLVLPLPPIALAETGASVTFTFALPKGAYATVLLREFLKTGASWPIPRR